MPPGRKPDPLKDEKKKVRAARQMIEEVARMDGNEAETRRRLSPTMQPISRVSHFAKFSMISSISSIPWTGHFLAPIFFFPTAAIVCRVVGLRSKHRAEQIVLNGGEPIRSLDLGQAADRADDAGAMHQRIERGGAFAHRRKEGLDVRLARHVASGEIDRRKFPRDLGKRLLPARADEHPVAVARERSRKRSAYSGAGPGDDYRF